MEDVVEKLKPKGRKPTEYRNTSNANIFTSNGRCHPGDTIRLKSDEAKQYDCLEKV